MKTSVYAAIAAVVPVRPARFGLRGPRRTRPRWCSTWAAWPAPTSGPGLHFKVPLVESVRVFDRRFRTLETAPERYLTLERKDVSVDFFAVGYIYDVRAFYRATGGDDKAASDRLAPIINDSLRNEINSRTLQQLVSGDRNDIVVKQLAAINDGAATLGMQITDIRLKQIDLPDRQRSDQAGLRAHARPAHAGGQQAARRRRGAGPHHPRRRRPRPDRAGRRGRARCAEAARRRRRRRRPHLRRSRQPRSGVLRLPAQPGGLPRLVQPTARA